MRRDWRRPWPGCAAERDAIVLRYFQNKSFAELGALTGKGEAAAKKSVQRAVEKLRHFFHKRGVESSAGHISRTISAHSIQPASALLPKNVVTVALAKGVTASLPTLTLIKGALKLMARTKAKTAVAGAAAAFLIGTTTIGVITVEHLKSVRLESYFTTMNAGCLETAPPMDLVRPTRYFNKGDYVVVADEPGLDEKVMRRACTFAEILETAYGVERERMVLPRNLPRGQFDLHLRLPVPIVKHCRVNCRDEFCGIKSQTARAPSPVFDRRDIRQENGAAGAVLPV